MPSTNRFIRPLRKSRKNHNARITSPNAFLHTQDPKRGSRLIFRTTSTNFGIGCTARQRCWRFDWVLDIDIKGFFDSIDWELLLKALRHHTDCPWVLLYIE